MSMPKDFSEDGAVGAGSSTVGSETGGFQVSDAGPNGAPGSAPPDFTKGSADYNAAWGTPTGTPDLSYTAFGLQDAAGNQYDTTTGVKMTKGADGSWTDPTRSADLQKRATMQKASRGAGVDPYASDTPGLYSFEDGGAVDDGGDGGDSNDGSGALPHSMDGMQGAINKALEVVDNALSYGRKLHGLPDGGGVKQDTQAGSAGDATNPRFQDFNKSPDVTDRRDERFWNPLKPAVGPVNDFIGKAYSLYDRATSPDNTIDKNNPIANDLGGEELRSDGQQHQQFQKNLADQQGEGAIPDNDEDDQ